MKRIMFVVVCLAAAGLGYVSAPDEFRTYGAEAEKAARWAWQGVQANPLPVALAVGTFLLTVIYHKAKGKSLRESVEAAATRVTVVTVPASEAPESENPVVRRAKARATRSQLVADQIGLQNQFRKLPEDIQKAERDACYTEQAVADAERKLADRRKAHEEATARLDALQKEQATAAAELAAIDAELSKLAEVV